MLKSIRYWIKKIWIRKRFNIRVAAVRRSRRMFTTDQKQSHMVN